ncbi:MAG TPA: hypothetical protein P5320_02265 [Bacteroidales bacterium]|nr:hypothetical protein [Bacteroidales bacterium]HRR15520.1 hypothetical protein [Bacteroidales bacterium]HRT46908.1 hypothetical protein [Bacteroidales bacterium]HRU55872.1 hypothetical protein [Bacteroidales bacterium]
MNLNDFIDFINTYRTNEYIGVNEWKDILNKNCPDWESLVKDPENWQSLVDLVNVHPEGSVRTLYHVFLAIGGGGLASCCLNSSDYDKKDVARWYLIKYNLLTPQFWKAFTDEIKEDLINYTFNTYRSEPFETYERFYKCIENNHYNYCYRLLSEFSHLQKSYIPSPQVSHIKSVISKARDKRFLKVINDMIKEEENACNKAFSIEGPLLSIEEPLLLIYLPTRDERELIDRALKEFKVNYMSAQIPPIYLSFETPPLFISYPELEEEYEKITQDKQRKDTETRIPGNKERRRPDTISIEEVLGCYRTNPPSIILYIKGLDWLTRKNNLKSELLRGIVLVHEVGHWITHLLPTPNVPFWPTEHYNKSSMEVHEGWAQLITWWVVDEISGEIKKVFDYLNKYQSSPYNIYKNFTSKSRKSVINSLDVLRKLGRPAVLNDWQP